MEWRDYDGYDLLSDRFGADDKYDVDHADRQRGRQSKDGIQEIDRVCDGDKDAVPFHRRHIHSYSKGVNE